MSVESTTTIAGLNALWPQGTDVKAEGDDHLRLIKSVLKADALDQADLTAINAAIASKPGATAQARNRIVNGAMQISQENGDTGGTGVTVCAADQWFFTRPSSGVAANVARSRGPTPFGSNNMAAFLITTAKASPAAADYCAVVTEIEGIRIADFGWGTAAARQVVLRFCIYSSYAGTFNVALNRTPAYDRCFVKSFTIAAGEVNTYKYVTIVIPGDTTAGTWGAGTAGALELAFPVGVGSNFTGATDGVWQAGNKYQIAGSTNGMGAVNNQFYLTDVGLYLDPNNTGVAPPWQMPDEAEELRACQRYWWKLEPSAQPFMFAAYNDFTARRALISYATTMRTQPAIVVATSSGTASASSGTQMVGFVMTGVGVAAQIYFTAITANARM